METQDEQTTNSQPNSDEGAGDGAGAENAQASQQEQRPAQGSNTPSAEAYRRLQSDRDRLENELKRQRDESQRAIDQAREAGRQATLAGLKPEERDAQIRAWNLEDRERRLQETEREQEQVARALTITDLSQKYGLDDTARADLEKITDVNEMRARAAELRVETLQRELEAAKAGTGTTPSEAQPAPKGMRNQPEGSGNGSQNGGYDPGKFRRTGDVAGALRAQREAGAVKYEKIPTRR